MLTTKRHLFDIPDNIAYFNAGYITPMSKAASEAGIEGISRKSNPWTLSPANFFDETLTLKTLFASLVNASPDDIAIIPSASYGLASAAKNIDLKPDQKILVIEDQFPSNIYCWQERARETGAEIEVVKAPKDRDWTTAVLSQITDGVAVAALPNNHWADGGILDLVKIGAALRGVGAKLVLDVTQSLGVMPLDVRDIQPDFLIAAGYKWLLCPYSVSFMYVSPENQQGNPLEYNWLNRAGSEDFSGLVNYQDEYQPGAVRFDMGQRANFALLPMAVSALQDLLQWEPRNIYEALGIMNEGIAEEAAKLGLTAAPNHLRAKHFLGLEREEGFPEDLIAKMAAQNIYISKRGNSLRITPHVYNTEEDCERLITALATALGA